MKNILVLIHHDEGQESRFQAALDVVRAIEGHLICLDVAIMPASEFDAGLDTEREAEAVNRTDLEQRLAAEDVPWSWIAAEDYVQPAVVEAADLADLIVVNSENPDVERQVRNVAGGIAISSGKPVLAVPARLQRFDTGGAALIAWDGSRPSSAAVTAAVPLLQIAASVTLYEVDDGSIAAPADEAAAYLSRYGVHAGIRRARGASNVVDDLLLAEADSGQFSYVVMGAYSRPRAAELLFGGATRRMLRESPIPLLLAH